MFKLYGYFRSSAAYRVRIALNHKNIPHELAFVHLTRGGGEQFAQAYTSLNTQQLVPTLQEGSLALTQSIAIIEYLDERFPNPPLLGGKAAERARIRAIALAIACEIHPLNNLRVLKYLTGTLKLSEEVKNQWYRHWVETGLQALEQKLSGEKATGRFCHGDKVTLADVCLVPQLANARRFAVPLEAYPTLTRIEANCLALEAFSKAAPQNQPDAE
jgi:maleylpyruvate isomerase